MFLKGLFFCYQLAFAMFCGLAGMILGCIFAFMILFVLYLFGIHGSYLNPIGYFLEATLGIIFFLGVYNIADKPRKFLFKRFL